MVAIIIYLILGMILWSVIGYLLLWSSNTQPSYADLEYVNPKWIWKHYRVNWFGCFWLIILFSLISPFGTLGYWFYKLCTIGRK